MYLSLTSEAFNLILCEHVKFFLSNQIILSVIILLFFSCFRMRRRTRSSGRPRKRTASSKPSLIASWQSRPGIACPGNFQFSSVMFLSSFNRKMFIPHLSVGKQQTLFYTVKCFLFVSGFQNSECSKYFLFLYG